MFSEDLERYKESGRIVGIHSYKYDPSKFDVGRVIAYDSDYYVMASISKFGRRDGFLLQEIENIVRIDEGSAYLNKIAALQRYYNDKFPDPRIENDPVYSLLDYCRSSNRIATVELLGSGNDDAVGFIEELDFDACVVKQISDDGNPDGTTSLLLKDISYICCCSSGETMLEVLSSELFDEMRKG